MNAFPGVCPENTIKKVKYTKIVPITIKAIKMGFRKILINA
jgi:hypothetical protein